MKKLPVLLMLGVLLSRSGLQADETGKARERSAQDVLQAFIIAMFANDKAGVRKDILPAENSEVLWQGGPIPKEALSELKAQLENMKFREYKVGETIDLPGGRKVKVTDKIVNENSRILNPIIGGEPLPVPLPVLKVKGKWKVDARSIIAARLAAQRAREKETPKKSTGKGGR